MRVNTRSRHKNAGRPPEKSAPGFLQYVRGRPCIFHDEGGCAGKIVPAHLDWAGGKGMGSKVADRYCVPMCGLGHHARQHSIGWDSFMAEMGVTREQLLLGSAKFWNAWPGRAAWERKQEAA